MTEMSDEDALKGMTDETFLKAFEHVFKLYEDERTRRGLGTALRLLSWVRGDRRLEVSEIGQVLEMLMSECQAKHDATGRAEWQKCHDHLSLAQWVIE